MFPTPARRRWSISAFLTARLPRPSASAKRSAVKSGASGPEERPGQARLHDEASAALERHDEVLGAATDCLDAAAGEAALEPSPADAAEDVRLDDGGGEDAGAHEVRRP